MARYQITCINKTNREDPHARIQAVGGPGGGGWRLTVAQVIALIKGGDSFYVTVNGRTVDVIIAVHLGHEYIKTVPDGIYPNNLLALPECPR
jgi:hypothetical protein